MVGREAGVDRRSGVDRRTPAATATPDEARLATVRARANTRIGRLIGNS